MEVAGASWARWLKGCESFSEDETVVLGKTSAVSARFGSD